MAGIAVRTDRKIRYILPTEGGRRVGDRESQDVLRMPVGACQVHRISGFRDLSCLKTSQTVCSDALKATHSAP